MIYDIMTYHAIMIANPVRPNIASKGIQVSRKIYFTWLPFQPHSLNLSANIGISETISQEAQIEKTYETMPDEVKVMGDAEIKPCTF